MRFQRTIPLSLSLAVATSALSAQGGSLHDYRPTQSEVLLNTNFTQITPVNGAPYNVSGGVFLFRNVHIPAGTHVRGVGTKPMIWVVTGSFRVDGELSVDGSDGQVVNTLNSAFTVALGGTGACTSGDGGKGSPNTTSRSPSGEQGYGPANTRFFGGGPGSLGSLPTRSGSGGGGGVFATAGDPHYRAADGLLFHQQLGDGGLSWGGSRIVGGSPGPTVFVDGNASNNFFGTGYDLNRLVVVRGELKLPIGGQGGGGGGGGGDYTTSTQTNFITDNMGGGGGAGGGVVIVLALGKITVGPMGQIHANGGNGGGGELAGSNTLGGGGGGGSGGMVIIVSKKTVELHAHGETFANQDYSFSLSADGGVGTQGRWQGVSIEGKYPPTGSSAWSKPSGGFGGLGIVQIHTPIGRNADGTNTIFDDNIDIVKNGKILQGTEKQRYIAWRGYPDANGVLRSDFGQPTAIGRNAGDIRPTPILQPLF